MDVAVLAKDADGELQVERHDGAASACVGRRAGRGRACIVLPVGIAAVAVGAGAVQAPAG